MKDIKEKCFNSLKKYKDTYKVFFKYSLSSFSSFIVDILFFTLFVYLFKQSMSETYIVVSTILARIISSIFNYLINHKYVFNSKKNRKQTVIMYFSLVISKMILSGLLVTFLVNKLNINETIVKIFVDTTLFFMSFIVQDKYIFKNKIQK